MSTDMFDLFIVGGGINGTGIARDAAGRGLRVMLCEQADLASATSSASTKLIHGGLRYLEYYEFRLVREALFERERLLSIAPHIIWPLRFVLPHNGGLRPAWLVRLGLFLYDHLAPRGRLPSTRGVALPSVVEGAPLKAGPKRGFIYSDCWVQDARLVVLNAMDAAARGAKIATRTRCVQARRENGIWQIDLQDQSGVQTRVQARILVNAAGPWVSQTLTGIAAVDSDKHVRLIKGSHIIVPRLYDGDQAYILQNPDKRIVFTIPYEQNFTLIGTTDIPYEADPAKVAISADETAYLCDSVSQYFKAPVRPSDVVWTYSGVRPLYDDAAQNASAVTRDYVLDVNTDKGGAPILSVFGGKITTYRRLAEHALEKLQPFIPHMNGAWTDRAPLPGGDFADFETFLAALRQRHPWLDADLAKRLARNYGSRADMIIGDAKSMAAMGPFFGAGLSAREVDYLIDFEFARSAEDILWRRSKLGLHMSEAEKTSLNNYLSGIVR